jgi:hypothetical protein
LFIGVKLAKLAKTNKEIALESSNEIKNYIGDQMNRWGSKKILNWIESSLENGKGDI